MATFTRKYYSRAARKYLKAASNSCVCMAVARALSDDPEDDEEVAVLAALVEDELRKTGDLDEKGTYWGPVSCALDDCEIEYTSAHVQSTNGWTRTDRYPTVAQFLRKHPEINEAVVRTTGHAGYMKDGVSYGLGARARVDSVYVLD